MLTLIKQTHTYHFSDQYGYPYVVTLIKNKEGEISSLYMKDRHGHIVNDPNMLEEIKKLGLLNI